MNLIDKYGKWIGPSWWSMDGQEPQVYALDIHKTERCGRAILEVAY